MKFIYLSIFIFSSLIFSIYSEPNKKNVPESENILLWEGEINAIYKEKGRVRIFIPADPEWTGTTFAEVKENLFKELNFPIRQKITKKIIGDFEIREVLLENIIEKKGEKTQFQVVLNGKINLRETKLNTKISNDFTISKFKKEITYIDPSGYFKETRTEPHSQIIHPKDKKEMVFVSGGIFLFGQGKYGDSDDYNPHFNDPDFSNLMDLPSFYIDKYEVTNYEYDRFLRETGNKPPFYWENGEVPMGKEDHPVIHLTYREVEAYANWAGKRIPTEFEWEKAARGKGIKETKRRDDGFNFDSSPIKFPFGNQFNDQLCNSFESGNKDTVSVYNLSPKGASPYGAIGMCGNAPEWTSSWYTPYQGHNFKSNLSGKSLKVIRGGSYLDNKNKCSVHYRAYGGLPNLREDKRAGFRLVKDYNQP
jgi:formylglycine-generating enzyme required for sulfatase activity